MLLRQCMRAVASRSRRGRNAELNAARPELRSAFPHFRPVVMRSTDCDAFGYIHHVNCYSYFETAISQFMIEEGLLDLRSRHAVGLIADSGCSRFVPVSFPDLIGVGMRVARIDRDSMCFEFGLFRNDEEASAAAGFLVYVYADRQTGEFAPVPEAARRVLAPLAMPASSPPAGSAV
jgi:acyl-CoA thioester hydrolase